ncbi:MAG: cytochrome [Actinomycetia bacterium]|nr:cytochrome [Actinomycetes bacterium]
MTHEDTKVTAPRCPFDRGSIGEAFDPLAGPQSEELHAVLRAARAEFPVFFSPALNLWVVTRYDDMLTVVNDRDRFTSNGVLDAIAEFPPEVEAILAEGVPHDTAVLTSVEGQTLERLRSSVSRALTPKSVAALEPRMREIADRYIDGFIDDGQVDIFRELAYPLPLRVILDYLGIPEADEPQIAHWAADWMELQFSMPSKARQLECARSIVAHHRYLRTFIAERRARPRDDFTSRLIAAIDAGEAEISDDELVLLLGITFTGAAHESMSSAISAILLQLLRDRKWWEEACADPSLVPDIVEEVLRFDGPGGFFREVVDDTELGGVTIPRGARVMFYPPSVNRDETRFEDPDRFDPHRRDKSRHLSFSHGPHFCLGASFARAELRVVTAALVERIPSLRLPEQDFVYFPSVPMRRLDRLMVEWDVASPIA